MTSPATSHPAAVPPVGPRKAHRSIDERLVGGVAAGLGEHLGVGTFRVRVGFVVLTAVGLLGLMLYAGLWMTLPAAEHLDRGSPGVEAATRQGKRQGRQHRLEDVGPLVAIGAVAIGLAVIVDRVVGGSGLFWPVLLGVVGLTVLWRQADEAQRERWLDSSGRVSFLRAVVGSGGLASYARLAAGIGLLLAALVVFAVQSGRGGSLGGIEDVVVAGVLGVGGLALMIGPWLFRLSGDLSEERAARVRSQERADMAAHLHDSVLQTLALIQKHAGDGRTVATLARAQERDFRSWLYGAEPAPDESVASALRAAAAEVEDSHGVPVDVVLVGDAAVTERTRPLVLAAREAMVNAARHSGADKVDVYVECEPGEVAVFVRDRGRGFEEADVPADRHGVRDSIRDRMRRHGGTAVLRTAPGEGTEVRLVIRTEPASGPSTDPDDEPETREADA